MIGDEELWALDRVSKMSKPWGRRELKCVSVETLELMDFFLGLDVSILQGRLGELILKGVNVVKKGKGNIFQSYRENFYYFSSSESWGKK